MIMLKGAFEGVRDMHISQEQIKRPHFRFFVLIDFNNVKLLDADSK